MHNHSSAISLLIAGTLRAGAFFTPTCLPASPTSSFHLTLMGFAFSPTTLACKDGVFVGFFSPSLSNHFKSQGNCLPFPKHCLPLAGGFQTKQDYSCHLDQIIFLILCTCSSKKQDSWGFFIHISHRCRTDLSQLIERKKKKYWTSFSQLYSPKKDPKTSFLMLENVTSVIDLI